MKFSTKLTSSAIIAALIVVPLFSFTVFFYARTILRDEIINQNKGTARNALMHIDRILYGAYRDIRIIAKDRPIEEWFNSRNEAAAEEDAAELKEIEIDVLRSLEEKILLTGPWDTIFLVDSNGVIVASTNQEEIGRHIAEEPKSKIAYRFSMHGEVYYSDNVISDDTGRPTIIFAAPIRYEEGGPILGVAIANFAWPVIEEVLDNLTSPGHAHLLNKEGMVIAASTDHKDEFLHPSFASHPLVKKAFEGNTVTSAIVTMVETDVEVLAVHVLEEGFFSYKGNAWGLLVESPVDTVLKPIFKMAVNIGIITTIIMAVLVGVFYFIGKILSQPITTIGVAVKQIASGDLSARAKVTTKDEIGLPATALK